MLTPKFFQIDSRMIAGIAQRVSPSQSIGAMPIQPRAWFSSPKRGW